MKIISRIIERPVKHAQILPMDFKMPWWTIFWQQRRYIALTILYLIVDETFSTLLPLILGWVLVNKSLSILLIVQVFYAALEILGWFTYFPGLTRIYNQVQDSFHFNAHNYLLTIDPIYHVRRSSGMIIGKIKRTTIAYFDFIEKIIDDLLPFFVEFTTVLISVFIINVYLGLIIFGAMTIIGSLFAISIIYATQDIEQEVNEQDDITSQVSTESVNQAQFIRACFATQEVKDRLLKQHLLQLKSQTILWMTYPVIQGLYILIYMVATGCIIAYMIELLRQGSLSAVLATTLLLTYFRGTRKIFKLDSMVLTILQSYRRIKDFYSFVNDFGKQTFPVLPGEGKHDVVVDTAQPTRVFLDHVTFSYPEQVPLFADISLDLMVKRDQTNKLYGVIGPSGIGKTTLISVLGGQLKPDMGTVSINDINIYSIDDEIRQKLIAIQGQVATSMRGSLRYNVLFGLPREHQPEDDVLIDILINVGLWKLFEAKKGLKTYIGEGGMNLSGGQRQRLNFANLYLRANYYKPLLILIDEPTSSLDEVSEQALTRMIDELAQTSVTFVIAHRLKTLEQAHGLLDLSLISEKQMLAFYTPDELKKRSAYFNQLLEGVAPLG